MSHLKTFFHKLKFPLAALVLLGISLGTWCLFDTSQKSDPRVRVKEFLTQLQKGHLKEAKEYFGGGPCPCRISGGWISYLLYRSGQEPNLAFLTGRKFSLDEYLVGRETIDARDKTKRNLRLDVPITFSREDRPLFLPLQMAFGSKMNEQELIAFASMPESEWWKGFSLRLRPALSKRAIDPPAIAQIDPKTVSAMESEFGETEQLIQLLGSDVTEFLTPRDAGSVNRADGSYLSERQVEAMLPRLGHLTMSFYLSRQEPSPVWYISNCKPTDPVIETRDTETGTNRSIALKIDAGSQM